MRTLFIRFILAAACLAALCSCSKDEPRVYDKVMILYSCGYNNLSGNLTEDVNDLAVNRIPGPDLSESSKLKLLVFIHTPATYGNYTKPNSPVLMELRRDRLGMTVRDTLVVYPEDTRSSDASTLKNVLTYIKNLFPSKEYGLVFSSHATGWLPKGAPYRTGGGEILLDGQSGWHGFAASQGLSSYINYNPESKTLGAQYINTSGNTYEIEAKDFAQAIPMHLKYVALDACLSGGIELAYELKGKTDWYIASQTEIPVDGFPYKTMTQYLLFSADSDVKGLAKAYYEHYAPNGYGVISVVDCNHTDRLAEVCATLFEKYRDILKAKNSPAINAQRYDGNLNWPWFYDLEDMLLKAGIDESEQAALSDALKEAVVYKAATKYSFGREMKHHSGLSIYLPAMGRSDLDEYYKGFSWNRTTALVK